MSYMQIGRIILYRIALKLVYLFVSSQQSYCLMQHCIDLCLHSIHSSSNKYTYTIDKAVCTANVISSPSQSQSPSKKRRHLRIANSSVGNLRVNKNSRSRSGRTHNIHLIRRLPMRPTQLLLPNRHPIAPIHLAPNAPTMGRTIRRPPPRHLLTAGRGTLFAPPMPHTEAGGRLG